jgi:NTE family protein
MMDANNPIDWTGQKKVSLALQGGGSHGAFTWGVLDYLPEDGRLDIFNPLNINPLRDRLEKRSIFAKVRALTGLKLIVAATNLQSGKIKVFEGRELTADHVMASACLPNLFQAVEIDGMPYWDGGYMGNPALFPLFYKTACPDIVIVQVNPIERDEVPRSAHQIQDRLNAITFNGTLLSEMRAIDFVNRLIDSGKLSRDDYMRPFVHRIDGGRHLESFPASSKLDASWFLIGKAIFWRLFEAATRAIGRRFSQPTHTRRCNVARRFT